MRAPLVCLAAFLLVATGWGQPSSRRVVTLDVEMQAAQRVVVGKVTTISPRKDSGGYALAPGVTFAVEETLKGERAPTIRIVGYTSEKVFERMRAAGHRVLVFRGAKGNEDGAYEDTGFVDLDDAGLWAATADYAFLRTADEVLDAAKAAIRGAEARPKEPVLVAAPTREFEATYARLSGDGYPIAGVVVPADARLERRARNELASKAPDVRLRGLQNVRPFKSEENVGLVRRLLKDPTKARWADPRYNWGIEVWRYPIRRSALETLEGWGVKVGKRPVVEETFDRTATQTALIVSDPQSIVPEDRLPTLPRFPRLESLQIMIYRVGDAHLATIAKAKNLVALDVGDWSEITDAGLAPLTEMPRLRTLNLSASKVTDAGLPTLARIKSLRTLQILATKVTREGVAAFRRLRPDVEVTFEAA